MRVKCSRGGFKRLTRTSRFFGDLCERLTRDGCHLIASKVNSVTSASRCDRLQLRCSQKRLGGIGPEAVCKSTRQPHDSSRSAVESVRIRFAVEDPLRGCGSASRWRSRSQCERAIMWVMNQRAQLTKFSTSTAYIVVLMPPMRFGKYR